MLAATNKWQEQRLYRLATGVILIIFGIFLSDIPLMIASHSWPSTTGEITSRTLVGQKFEEYDGDYYTNIDGYIRYQYTVEGIAFSSTAVNAIDSPFYPYETALQYPKGIEVQVYYNPRRPTQAVLEPGWVSTTWVVGFFPSLFFLAGFYILAREIYKLIRKNGSQQVIFPKY